MKTEGEDHPCSTSVPQMSLTPKVAPCHYSTEEQKKLAGGSIYFEPETTVSVLNEGFI